MRRGWDRGGARVRWRMLLLLVFRARVVRRHRCRRRVGRRRLFRERTFIRRQGLRGLGRGVSRRWSRRTRCGAARRMLGAYCRVCEVEPILMRCLQWTARRCCCYCRRQPQSSSKLTQPSSRGRTQTVLAYAFTTCTTADDRIRADIPLDPARTTRFHATAQLSTRLAPHAEEPTHHRRVDPSSHPGLSSTRCRFAYRDPLADRR